MLKLKSIISEIFRRRTARPEPDVQPDQLWNVIQNPIYEGALNVDFDEITQMFAELKPAVSGITDVHDFTAMLVPVTDKIILKYFEFPGSRVYKPEDLSFLIEHMVACINNIIPPHIPYESYFENGKWILIMKEPSDTHEDIKPN